MTEQDRPPGSRLELPGRLLDPRDDAQENFGAPLSAAVYYD